MKKKPLWLVLGGVVIIAVFAVAISLILSSKKNEDNLNSNQKLDLKGVWLVYQYLDNIINDEFMVFTEDTVADYRGRKTGTVCVKFLYICRRQTEHAGYFEGVYGQDYIRQLRVPGRTGYKRMEARPRRFFA